MHRSNNVLFTFGCQFLRLKASVLWILLQLSVAFLLVSCEELAKLAQQADASHDELGYEVLKVSDGDTMQMLDMRTKEKVRVRLYGVDAPEKKQAFGLASTQFASQTLLGKKVNLRPRAKDQYGRIVAEVFLADGTNFNEELLRKGYAWHYKQYSKDPQWALLEDKARSEKAGLWSGKRPTPPWDYRKKQRADRTGKKSDEPSAPSNNLTPNGNQESELVEEDLILQPLVK